jgi:imidazolonepropionase-like amidohydrolase
VYYKLEAYTASEKAGKILYQHNITPTYVSDDPLLNSQHVILEAARAYSYGLPYHAALAGVTSAPAELLGLGDRLGKIKEGFDADIVVWDSDPLSLGATPVQVWIDGAPQFENPVILKKQYHGPVRPDEALAEDFDMIEVEGSVAFTGIKYMYLGDVEVPFEDAVAIAKNGTLVCVGPCKDELASAAAPTTLRTIRLKNGFITPPFTAFGSLLGLVEVRAEHEMQDGPPPKDGISRAVDGLLFGGKQLASAFEHGVARAISAPGTGSIEAKGVSVGFRTGAKHSLEKGAIWKEEVALYYSLTLNSKTDETPSISSAVGQLRQKLLSAVDGVAKESTLSDSSTKDEEDAYLKRVLCGTLPLVLSVHSADTISSIIRLKSEVETAVSATSKRGLGPLNIIIFGGAESHLVASFLAAANISVILAPLYSNSITWDQRRCLPGAPLTNGTAIDILLDAGVLVGISVDEYGGPRNLGHLCGIAYANSEGRLGMREALDLAGKNFDRMLELGGTDDSGRDNDGRSDWVVWEGNPLEIGGRVRGMGTLGRTVVWD